ncbi:hypothetical protein [Chitinophaga sp.]|nr:hypothetical protein [Chitinophaga sp.]HWV65542.1 hypothetical protein [Chitinophaga sp.]
MLSQRTGKWGDQGNGTYFERDPANNGKYNIHFFRMALDGKTGD